MLLDKVNNLAALSTIIRLKNIATRIDIRKETKESNIFLVGNNRLPTKANKLDREKPFTSFLQLARK